MKLQLALILATTLAVTFPDFAAAHNRANADSTTTATLTDTKAALRDL